jgi:TPR repeat protein
VRPHYQRELPFVLGGSLQGLRKAAAAGIASAQFELSLWLREGLGGKRDSRTTARWERKAAEAGHPGACFNLASRLASAKKPDFEGAAGWYRRAAEAGDARAASRLCRMYLAGQGVARDETIARTWYERAVLLGHDWSAELQG